MTMRESDHTHPDTDEPFGLTFRRDPAVVTDGGTPDDNAPETTDTMADISHRAPTEGAIRSFERGTEGREQSV